MRREQRERFSIRKTNRGAVSACIAILSFLSLAMTSPQVSASDDLAPAATAEATYAEPAEVEATEATPVAIYDSAVAEEMAPVATADAASETLTPAETTEELAPADQAELSPDDDVDVTPATAVTPIETTPDSQEETGDVVVRYHAVDKAGEVTKRDLKTEAIAVKDGQDGDDYDATADELRPASIVTEDGRTYVRLDLTDNSSRDYTDGQLAETDDDDLFIPGEEKGSVTVGKTTVVNYYYEEEAVGDVLVRYLSDDGMILQSDAYVIQGGRDGDAYDTTAFRLETLEVDGRLYRFDRAEGDAEQGTVDGNETKVINYYYAEALGSVEVRYHIVDADGNVLATDVVAAVLDTSEAPAGTGYDTTEHRHPEIIVDGLTYALVNETTNPHAYTDGDAELGTIVAGEFKTVNYYYVEKVKYGSVSASYVTVDGTELAPTEVVVDNAEVGTSYTTVQKSFDGYEFVKVDESGAPATGTVEEADQLVTYIYKPEVKYGSVQVRYIAEDGSVLEATSPVVENAEVGTSYTTVQKSFAGYEFVKVDESGAPATGVVEEADQLVTYIYKPEVKYGSVQVRHIAEDGSVLESTSPVVENAEVGTSYTTVQKSFAGYEFVKVDESGAPATGVVEEVDQVVTYIYKALPILTDADQFDPIVTAQSVEVGAEVVATGFVSNLDELPAGTSVSLVGTIDSTVAGTYPVSLQVLYPDGSSEQAETSLTVTEPVVEAPTAEEPVVVPETPAEEPVTEVVDAPVSEEPIVTPETPVEENYRSRLVTEQASLQAELASLEAEIAAAEALLQTQVQDGEVLSAQLTLLRDNLTQVTNRLADLDTQLQTIDSQIQTVDADLVARQAELATLKANNPQGQLVSDISQLEAQIKTHQERIAAIDGLIAQKQAELNSLQDEAALSASISQKETALNNLKNQIASLQTERETYRQTQQSKIDGLKAQLATMGAKVTTTVQPDKVVAQNGDFRGYSDTVWTNKGKQHEQVRFTGDREVIVELTPAQAQEFETTGSFTYTVNEAKVEEYFYQYLAEIRANNGITIPLTKTAAASDYSQRRARENAASDILTHDTALPDSSKGMYENAGYLYLGTYKSDQELAYQLAWQWFSDYSNVHGATGADGGYGHRNNLLSGSLVRYTDGSPAGVVQGDGLGIFENATSKKWHYLQNGYDYTLGFNYTDVAYSLDAQNNQSLTINGVTKPTVFMDALNFTYVIKGYTETTVNQAYANLEAQILQEEKALTTRLAEFDAQITSLENGTPSLLERETELTSLKATLADLPAKRQQLTQDIQTLQNEQATLTAEIARLEQEVAAKRATLVADQTSQQQQALEQEIQALMTRKEELLAQRATVVSERQQLLGEQGTLNQDIATLEQEERDQAARLQEFETTLNQSRRDQNELQAKINDVVDKIDNVDNFDQRNQLNTPVHEDVIIETVTRLTLNDVNGTGVTVELNSDEGATVLKVLAHIEPTDVNPEPLQQLAGLDYDLYDIVLEDDQGNRITALKAPAVVKLPVDAGKTVVRVIYLPEVGEPEELTILKQETGFVYFETNHFSHYGVVYASLPTGGNAGAEQPVTVTPVPTKTVKQQPSAQAPKEGAVGAATSKQLPNTGDSSSILALLGLGLTSFGAVGMGRRRKEN